MNVWTCFLINLAIRWDERHDRRVLHGETLIAAVAHWGTSARKPS